MNLRPSRELTERGGHGVARRLTSMHSGPGVFWSERGNSYVVVEPMPGVYRIYSINGIGEIRWAVEEWNSDEESNQARDYFLLPDGVCEHGYAQGCRACDPDR